MQGLSVWAPLPREMTGALQRWALWPQGSSRTSVLRLPPSSPRASDPRRATAGQGGAPAPGACSRAASPARLPEASLPPLHTCQPPPQPPHGRSPGPRLPPLHTLRSVLPFQSPHTHTHQPRSPATVINKTRALEQPRGRPSAGARSVRRQRAPGAPGEPRGDGGGRCGRGRRLSFVRHR